MTRESSVQLSANSLLSEKTDLAADPPDNTTEGCLHMASDYLVLRSGLLM